jgi:hypothetical protein
MLRAPKPPEALARDDQPASAPTVSAQAPPQLRGAEALEPGVDGSPRMAAQRRRVQAWARSRAGVVQRMKIVPYEGKIGGYSSQTTFDKMVNVGEARGSGEKQPAESQPMPSSKMEDEEKLPSMELATSSSSTQPLKQPRGLSGPELEEWQKARKSRLAKLRSTQSPLHTQSSWRSPSSSKEPRAPERQSHDKSHPKSFGTKSYAKETGSSSRNWRAQPPQKSWGLGSASSAKEPEQDERNVQSYAVITGFDGDDPEPKVLLARKSVVNRHTTKEGKREAQESEMRAPGQLGLPGGKSRDLGGYKLLEKPQAEEEPGIAPLAVESGADEALAETGINVRSDGFDTLGYTYARDEDKDVIKGERTHAFFVYKGQISELAQRANEVLASLGTADNEVSELVVAPLSSAMKMMEQARQDAEEQARQIEQPKDRARFIGDGVDWHEGPLNALQDLKLSGAGRPEPPKLQAFPDAVKWIGATDETPLPQQLMPPERKDVATTSTSLKEEQKDEPVSLVEPGSKMQAMGPQVSREPSEPQVLATAEHLGPVKASDTTLAKAPQGAQRTPSTQGKGFTGGQIAAAMMLIVAIFAVVAKLSGAFG